MDKFSTYRKYYPQCVFYVYDKEWVKVLNDVDVSDTNEYKSYVITFEDGQILDYDDDISDSLPQNAYYIEDRLNIDTSALPLFSDILFNTESINCEHSQTIFAKYNKRLYATSYKNIGSMPFRINRFSSFSNHIFNKLRKRPKHSNILGYWFSDQDFKMWYQQPNEWIFPGETICDYTNYGQNCFWILDIEYENGKREYIAFKK